MLDPSKLLGKTYPVGEQRPDPNFALGQKFFGYYTVFYDDHLFVFGVIQITGNTDYDRSLAERKVLGKHIRSDAKITTFEWVGFRITEPMHKQPLWRKIWALVPF